MTQTPSPRDRDWLPDFDLHEEEGELVLHAELHGAAGRLAVALDGDDLIVQTDGDPAHTSRLHLPFHLQAALEVLRTGPDLLEVRIPAAAEADELPTTY